MNARIMKYVVAAHPNDYMATTSKCLYDNAWNEPVNQKPLLPNVHRMCGYCQGLMASEKCNYVGRLHLLVPA